MNGWRKSNHSNEVEQQKNRGFKEIQHIYNSSGYIKSWSGWRESNHLNEVEQQKNRGFYITTTQVSNINVMKHFNSKGGRAK